MTQLRLVLILLLSVMLDFSSPVMPLGMESSEEPEEQAHRARVRRVVRLTHEHTEPVALQAPRLGAPRASALRAMSSRSTVPEIGVRKIPGAPGDSTSSSPEDQ